MSTTVTPATATLGGGCFWCLEAVFEQLRGVHSVVSGYAGGDAAHANYEMVCSGRTAHAEVVQVTYDPQVLTFDDVLNVFFATHDPTSKNRQGADVGPQYRSVIFVADEAQRQAATAKIAALDQEGVFGKPIVTEIAPLATFYPAEDYHQGYYRGHGQQGYCQAVIAPKVAKFRQQFVNHLRRGSAS
jgi:peptide-methionine (S)-S-oxide reductase